MNIWVDADACPKVVKEAIFKLANRLSIKTFVVANSYLSIPLSPNLSFIQVGKGSDVADQYIVDHVEKGDLVITADIPLASFVIGKEATAIDPRGDVYDEESIAERLSMRNFMQELRDSGEVTGGPQPLGAKDRERFINSLDKLVTSLLKK